MKVLVDTSVWSLALRRSRPHENSLVTELIELIHEVRAEIVGPIRQELLSGIREPAQFETLRERLRAFPDLPLTSGDFETAAEFCNLCRGKGIQGSNTDFLICAVAARRNLPIFTSDDDFTLFRQYLPVALHQPRG